MITDELRDNFQTFINNEQSKMAKLELEVRFGYFHENKFDSQLIDPNMFNEVKSRLDNLYKRYPHNVKRIITSRKVQYTGNGIRKIIQGDKIYFQKKTKVINYDNVDWGIRFAKSYEFDLSLNYSNDLMIEMERQYDRWTYIDSRKSSYFYGFQIDITEVITDGVAHYELELEALPNIFPTDIIKWWGAIKTLYGWTLNAANEFQIVSIKERMHVNKIMNIYLKNQDNICIEPGIVNRPKNLMSLEQIQVYAASVKVDGLHKILVIDESGIYLCSPKFNIIKIGLGMNIGTTIIEGEFLPQTKVFMAFDILINCSTSIMDYPFDFRYKTLRELIPKINVKYGSISLKTFYFGSEISGVIDEYKFNKHMADGIIFQSCGPYDNAIYKWKPPEQLTIDFYLDENYVPYVINRGELFRFNANVKSTSDVLVNTIVECKWNNKSGYWEPVRIRSDKMYPNSFKVAIATVKMLRNPITLEDVIAHFNNNNV